MTDLQPLGRGGATATAESATESRGELARGTALLRLFTASVAALTGGTRTTLTVLAAHHATRGSVRTLLLDVGGRDDLSGEVEPLAEVVKTLGQVRFWSLVFG